MVSRSIRSAIKRLPDTPGVYLFYNARGRLLYVGKATSLQSRVRSYFRVIPPRLPLKRGGGERPIEELIHQVAKIKCEPTNSVLEAVIREANYIKKFQPRYNVLGKDDKSWNYLALTKEEFPKLISVRQHQFQPISTKHVSIKQYLEVFGPYPGLNTKAAIKILRRIFRFSTCLPGIKRPCLYYEIGLCLGVCVGIITPAEYRRLVIRPLVTFLRGNTKGVISMFERQMRLASRAENFEAAARLRDQIRQLKRIQDVALLNKSWIVERKLEIGNWKLGSEGLRVEGYDISNLGPTEKVGSLVVFDQSGPVNSEYRKFIIRSVAGQSDVDCLREVLERRLRHSEWPWPDVILIDGGRPQVNVVKKVLLTHHLKMPVVGIAKGPERKRNDIILGSRKPAFIRWVAGHQPLLIQVRNEAHRFAVQFHRARRDRLKR